MAVVLPEPLGPTSPRISPDATWKLNPPSAWKPPKRLTSFETLRMGALSGDMPPPPCRERNQASGEKQHQPHDQEPVDQLEILRRGESDQIVDAIEDDDADDRAGDRGNAPKQCKHDRKDREIAAEDIVGIEYRNIPGIDDAGETRHERGSEPCDHPHPHHIDARH